MIFPTAPSLAPSTDGIKAMKRLICATVALSLLGATAAFAEPYHHGGFGNRGWHGRGAGGALIGLGVGLFALGAIAAASDHDRYYDRYPYEPPAPPPPPA